jgi:hypothetical protein
VFKDLARLAVEPIAQFLDGLHVAGRSLFDVRACDFAQFFSCPRLWPRGGLLRWLIWDAKFLI